MKNRVRLVHKVLEGFHIYTSPDVQGLHASSETKAGAQRAAIEIVDFLAKRDHAAVPEVAFLDQPVLQAAE